MKSSMDRFVHLADTPARSVPRVTDTTRLVTRAWWAVIVLLVFALPFELVTPLVNVGSSLAFTNLELLAATALILWLTRQILLRQFPTWRTPLTLQISALLLILFVAGLLAPSENVSAFKVVARWIAGALVFWMIVNAMEAGLPIEWLLRAAVVGGFIVAIATCAEVLNEAGVQPLLAPFRIGYNFRVGGELRPSATLAFPTINALYLECVFFFTISWLASEWQRRNWVPVSVLALALSIVATALVLTLTRSAVIAVALAAVLLILLRYPRVRFDIWSRMTAIGIAVIVFVLGALALSNPAQQLRLFTQNDTNWYRAQVTAPPLPPIYANEVMTTTVRVENVGEANWESKGETRVKFFYHWLSSDGKQMVVVNGRRTEIPHDVAPGASVELNAQILTPNHPGNYILAWDMLRENLFWFSTKGAPLQQTAVAVLPARVTPANAPSVSQAPPSNVIIYLEADRADLWRAGFRMIAAHPLFGVGPGNFRLVLGAYLGRPVFDTLHANNMYLEMFADTGILGGVAFLFLTVAIARLCWRGLKNFDVVRAKSLGDSRAVAQSFNLLGVIAALTAFFIHGVTDYFFEFTPTYLLFWFMLAALVTFTRAAEERG